MNPEGWDKLVEKYMPCETHYDTDPLLADKAFEAGADAMLEGLKKDPKVLLHIYPLGAAKFLKLVEDYYKE